MASTYQYILTFVPWLQTTVSLYIFLTRKFLLAILINSVTKAYASLSSPVYLYLRCTWNSSHDIEGCMLHPTPPNWLLLTHIYHKCSIYYNVCALCTTYLTIPGVNYFLSSTLTLFLIHSFMLTLVDAALFRQWLLVIILLGRLFPGLNKYGQVCHVSVQKW